MWHFVKECLEGAMLVAHDGIFEPARERLSSWRKNASGPEGWLLQAAAANSAAQNVGDEIGKEMDKEDE